MHDDNSLTELDTDIHNYGPRLRKLAFAAVVGAILTFFAVKGMTSTGRGPASDPMSTASVGMVAFAMFIVTTLFVHKVVSKKRPALKR